MPVASLPKFSGFQFVGGEYAEPLVYSVWVRGKLVIEPPDVGAADPVGDDVPPPLGVDGLLLQALAVPSASTARAAVPYLAVRHRRAVMLLVGLTCSYLLTSKSSCDPCGVAGGVLRARTARDNRSISTLMGFLSVLGSAGRCGSGLGPGRPGVAVEQVGYTG